MSAGIGTGRPERMAGFTLLEVLVAFIIAALALGALTQGAGGGLHSARVAAHMQDALSRAKSHLAVLDPSLQLGETSGDDGGGFTWRLQVTAAATMARPLPGTSLPHAKRPILYAVTINIDWRLDGKERSVALSTKRLGEAPPDPP